MSKVQNILADKKYAQENVKRFGDTVRRALEQLHSDEVSRQNSFAQGTAQAMNATNDDVQAVFDPICAAYDQIQLLAAAMGVELEDAEF